MQPLINWNKVRTTHELRERIVKTLAENPEPMSPMEVSKKLKANISKVSYHFKTLAKAGVLTLEREEPRRGAVEHFYALSPDVLLTQVQDWYSSGLADMASANFKGAAEEFKAALEKMIALTKAKPSK